ncbi:hypothetical protein TIFTF001_020009 [Ficus carica]|uniref:Uncharacterized protein n=1 Tax=Ficus carica TaxID=3494 RepID=A0AA88A9X5_FICCA|nr:hypothetical protein TIFTF001_020009 [Ficus carica]
MKELALVSCGESHGKDTDSRAVSRRRSKYWREYDDDESLLNEIDDKDRVGLCRPRRGAKHINCLVLAD